RRGDMDFSFWTAIVFTLLAFVVGLSLLRGNRSKRESDGQSGEVGVGGGSERNATRNKSEDDWMTDIVGNAFIKMHFTVGTPADPSEEQPLRYIPGMLRTSQLERLMSHEELDEERRVQRQQLAAIFQLLKENQETFGEVTERDMEEQLKLYSI
uniref:Matrix-remodeling-associated protein 7 helical domain-containing protein n=1 Tax=Denticeps clupeoides TaxID=299321 RepID=A0AAY4A1D5_9TELE